MMREILTIWRLRELELEDGKADGQSHQEIGLKKLRLDKVLEDTKYP